MIADLPEAEQAWLKAFFNAPNGLTWEALENGSARQDQIDAVEPWIGRLTRPASDTPLVLPFYRGERVSGWYATAITPEGERTIRSTLRAWFGPSYLTHLDTAGDSNPSAAAIRGRFGRQVLSFTGPETEAIASRLGVLAHLAAHRPRLPRTEPRPVGRIRADLEAALQGRDEGTALAFISELRGTGRLNEENLQFLNVRLQAGLGQWERIARDHWTIRNLSDLPLPPQTLSDLVEALYRVYIETLGSEADAPSVLAAFQEEILGPFPRLFASRHGVRAPRVVKAFILNERLQPRPNDQILASLLDLLPSEDTSWARRFFIPSSAPPLPLAPFPSPEPKVTSAAQPDTVEALAQVPPTPNDSVAVSAPEGTKPSVLASASELPDDEAERAFEDGQVDRAFEIDLSRPLHRKSLMRLVACVHFIGTDEARSRVLNVFDAQPAISSELSDAQLQRVEALRRGPSPGAAGGAALTGVSGWMDWARRLASGEAIERATTDALDNRSTWETQAPWACRCFRNRP